MKKYILSFTFCYLSLALCLAQSKKVSLLFAGDAMQHKAQLDAAKTADGYDYSSYFKHVKTEIERADIAVVNLEVTLPGKAYTGYPCFGSPDAFAYELKNAGFDVFLTANNHCLDKGKKGLERTINVLDSMGVKYTGTYANKEKRELQNPLLIIKNGIRIAMLNYTYGTNGIEVEAPNIVNMIDKKQIYRDIQSAKLMKADIIIANMHWGVEYKLTPHPDQKKTAKFLLDNGVRLVIGGHPHVVQPIDIQKQGDSIINNVVVYSMGNFVSGMKAVNTDGGMMVKIDISKEGDNAVTIDKCDYSLVWVHKPVEGGRVHYQLIPVSEYQGETGMQLLGATAYDRMTGFARTAKTAIESMWQETTTPK